MVRQKHNEKKKKRKQFQFKYKCDVPPTLLENKHRHSKKNIVNLLVEREKKETIIVFVKIPTPGGTIPLIVISL